MRSKVLSVPADVQAINIQMGTLPHPGLTRLSADELRPILVEREAEFERIKREHGDFTGAVREGTWDDGQRVVSGEALYTGEVIARLEQLGFHLTDIYATEVIKQGMKKPQTFVVMTRTLLPTGRVTDATREIANVMTARNWYQAHVWYNPLHSVPNLTINAFGNLREGTAANLIPMGADTGVQQDA